MPRDRIPAGSRGELVPLAIRLGRRLRYEDLESRQAPGVMLAWPSAGLGLDNTSDGLADFSQRQLNEIDAFAPIVEKADSEQEPKTTLVDSSDSEALLLTAEQLREASQSSAVENAALQQPQTNPSNDSFDAALLGLYGVDADAGLNIDSLEQAFAAEQGKSDQDTLEDERGGDENLLKNPPEDRPSALPPTPSGGGGSAGTSSGSRSGGGASGATASDQGLPSTASAAAAISAASAQAAEGEAVAEASTAASTTHAAVDCDSGDPSFPGDYNWSSPESCTSLNERIGVVRV